MSRRSLLTPDERRAKRREINRRYRTRHRVELSEKDRRYRKTPRGLLMQMYNNARARVTGVQRSRPRLYLGLALMPRQEFYDYAKGELSFWRLFAQWAVSGYDPTMTPSLDRIDSRLGYVLGNIRFVTANENRLQGSLSRWRKYREQQRTAA